MKLPFFVRTSGFINKLPYHSTPATKQNDFMICVFLSGSGFFIYPNQKIEVAGGMISIMRPENQCVLISNVTNPYQHYYCRFNGDYAKFLADKIILKRGNIFRYEKVSEIALFCREMGNYFTRENNRKEIIGHRELLLAKILITLAEEKTDKNNMVIDKDVILHYLSNHLDSPTNLSEIAGEFGISKSTLNRIVKKYFGTTLQKLHENMKIEWAKILLSTTNLSVKEIGIRVGYMDQLYFSRRFRIHEKISPEKWRRLNFLSSERNKEKK